MIDLIESDPVEDAAVFDWFDCALLSRADMLALIERCKNLDGRAVNLFSNALKDKPRSGLLEHYIGPNLYQPGAYYIYTTPDPNLFGLRNWRPDVTAFAAANQTVIGCGLFSNPLAWITEADLPPSERTYNAGFSIYTIESDSMPLDDQLRIIWSGKLKRIDAELRRFRDYRGHEAVYSGGKSLHLHFCFDLRHLKRDLCMTGNSSYGDNWTRDLPDCLLRPAHAANWDRLVNLFCEIAEIDRNEFRADQSLSRWEQLRRCPWALRLVNGAHQLHLPHGYLACQPVLASDIFQNAKRGAKDWFHDPHNLGDFCRDEGIRRRPKSFIECDLQVSSHKLTLFEEHAPAMFRQIIGSDYPNFAGFEVTGSGFKSFFFNGPDDHRPSSFCEGNRSRIVLQGNHNLGSDGITLSATPNQIFDWIISQHRVVSDRSADDWIMRHYKAVVRDRASLTAFLDEHLDNIVGPEASTHVVIRGPQGCGKSTKTITKLPAIYDRDPGVIAFSSPSIAQAEEKIDTFRRVNCDERFIPYLYLSLTALYEKFCPEGERVSHLDVLEEGGSSWLHTIHNRQPDVYHQMFDYRSGLFDLQKSGKIPVLFLAHESLRQHAAGGMTRIFYARDFSERWFEPMSKDERSAWKRDLLWENEFHRVIVDEVAAHDLVSIHKHDLVEWVHRCAVAIGFDQTEDIGERYANFARHLAEHPCKDMTWNTLLDVLACKYKPEHLVAVPDREVPFDDNAGIYAAMIGRRYYVQSRGWWNHFWRVAMLTTEGVPTRIIESIDGEAVQIGEKQVDRFQIYEFALPECSRDIVTIELQRACKKETLVELVRAYRVRYSEAEIISDMVKDRISEFQVVTHMRAKGSNAFIGSDIVAFYNAPSPGLFGELGALNSRFGRSDLIRLFYLDRFEQTCGRNRGFRGEQGRDHKAIFPPRLHNWLASALARASYVGVQAKASVVVNDDATRFAKRDEPEDQAVASVPPHCSAMPA